MTNERKIIRADEGAQISRAHPYSGGLRTYGDAGQLARAAAELFVNTAVDSIEARGRFWVALSGSTTPRRLYKLLATSAFSSRVDWARIGIFWGDERYVSADDPDSNYRMTAETLLQHVPIPLRTFTEYRRKSTRRKLLPLPMNTKSGTALGYSILCRSLISSISDWGQTVTRRRCFRARRL